MAELLAPRAISGGTVLDCGSMSHKGQPTYRPMVEGFGMAYIGLDVVAGDNVDIVEDIYAAEWFPSQSFDCVISGQMLEHLEHPWVAVDHMRAALAPGGWIILIAPMQQREHRYPLDCWRLLPDGMRSLLRGMDHVDAGLREGTGTIIDCWGVGRCPV